MQFRIFTPAQNHHSFLPTIGLQSQKSIDFCDAKMLADWHDGAEIKDIPLYAFGPAAIVHTKATRTIRHEKCACTLLHCTRKYGTIQHHNATRRIKE